MNSIIVDVCFCEVLKRNMATGFNDNLLSSFIGQLINLKLKFLLIHDNNLRSLEVIRILSSSIDSRHKMEFTIPRILKLACQYDLFLKQMA